jgi:hypothetical protein
VGAGASNGGNDKGELSLADGALNDMVAVCSRTPTKVRRVVDKRTEHITTVPINDILRTDKINCLLVKSHFAFWSHARNSTRFAFFLDFLAAKVKNKIQDAPA